jgi:hypothetical protein
MFSCQKKKVALHNLTTCTSPGTTFAWVGTARINFGFVSLISWDATTWLPIGFVLSGLHTIFLWWLAAWLEKGDHSRVLTTESVHDPRITTVVPASDDLAIEPQDHQAGVLVGEDTHADDLPHAARPQLPILASVLCGLALISMGVTGSFIPAKNLFCQHGGGIVPRHDSAGKWTTDMSSPPSNGVQQWAKQPQSTDQEEFGGTCWCSPSHKNSRPPRKWNSRMRCSSFTSIDWVRGLGCELNHLASITAPRGAMEKLTRGS